MKSTLYVESEVHPKPQSQMNASVIFPTQTPLYVAIARAHEVQKPRPQEVRAFWFWQSELLQWSIQDGILSLVCDHK